MKILMVVPNQYFSLKKAEIFKEFGHEVLVIDERHEYLSPAGNIKLVRKLIKKIRPLKILSKFILNSKIKSAARKFKPDILYLEKGMLVLPETLQTLRSQGIKTVNWFPDDLQEFRWVSENAQFFDYFFSFDSFVVDRLRDSGLKNSYYLPFAADPNVYSGSVVDERFKCDIAFVGAWYPEREEALKYLSGYDLKIWGWNWEKSSLSRFYQGSLPPQEIGKVFKNAKININIHFASRGHGANVRTFEITAARGFELSSYRKDIPDLFETGKEIEVFDNYNDMVKKVDFYLKNDKIREEIKEAGYRRAVKDHTFNSRIKQMLSILNA